MQKSMTIITKSMMIITIYRRRRNIDAHVCARNTIIVSENIAIMSNYLYIAQPCTYNGNTYLADVKFDVPRQIDMQ